MVASLQVKKEALEAKLRDKTSELKKLCIEEAELTGVLPAETPLEPGESPPQIRRRVGTAFTIPENLINKIKSKEDEALASLELECKIQTGIAEAALGLANDGTASKSVRRKHRVLYQESQRRLSELESRLNTLKQSQPKHKKKPRPHADLEAECDGDGEEVGEQLCHSALGVSLSERGVSPSMRHSHTYTGLPRHDLHSHSPRLVQSHTPLPGIEYRHSIITPEHISMARNCNQPLLENNSTWSWAKGREVWCNTVHHQFQYYPSEHIGMEASVPFIDRFGSLDRNPQNSQASEHENRVSSTLPRSVYSPNTSTVLLPSQTYPENSLMRTQSLGNMDSSKQLSDRKSKEKEWYESCLDSAPPRPPYLKPKSTNSSDYEPGKPPTAASPLETIPIVKTQQASVNNLHFDTVVPYESPKNHTVVQAGKWQPYREVSKPFEMSDFYKYSTKFRKGLTSNPNNHSNDATTPQQKGIYKPLQPQECQPISVINGDTGSHKISTTQTNGQQMNDNFSCDLLSWYHDKASAEATRSATLV